MQVLIVDDDEDTRILLSEDLRDLGFDTLAAIDGIHALQVARLQHPALVILDYRLPGGDGVTVLRRLKQNSETCLIPVIVFSRQHSLLVVEEVITAGAVSYVQKSFANEKLRAEVLRILGPLLDAEADKIAQTPLRFATPPRASEFT